jgi:hypothetical protein
MFRPPRSLILSGFIARECQASLQLKRLWAFTPETVAEEEGDESLLKTNRLCDGNIHFQSSHWSSKIM